MNGASRFHRQDAGGTKEGRETAIRVCFDACACVRLFFVGAGLKIPSQELRWMDEGEVRHPIGVTSRLFEYYEVALSLDFRGHRGNRCEKADARSSEANVSRANRQRAIEHDRDGMGAMVQQFQGVELVVPDKPCGGNIHAVCEDTEVCHEPHPVAAGQYGNQDWGGYAKNRAAPQRHQRARVWTKEAVWQMPGQQIGVRQGSAAAPPTEDVTDFVRECHHAPRCCEQGNELENACCQSGVL